MNVLAIDFGLKRIGIAVGSTESGIAFSREVLRNDENLFDRIAGITDLEDVKRIIVGMPFKRDGSVGDIDQELQEFILALEHKTSIPVELADERYTSKIAQSKLRELGVKEKAMKTKIDAMSAQVILQDWLDKNQFLLLLLAQVLFDFN